MRLAQTSRGLARQEDDHFVLLDTELSLEQLIRTGRTELASTAKTRDVVAVQSVSTYAPVRRPGKVCIVGLNYADHAAEIGAPLPKRPRFHLGVGSAVVNPGDPIVLPGLAPAEVDYEGEVALLVGTAAYQVSTDRAWQHIAGLTAANDVSARDVQLGRGSHSGSGNIAIGKSFDSFKPLGPAMLTADSIDPEQPLTLQTFVDGELRQQATTAELIFGFTTLVAEISRYVTLEPGDVILTGTPAGVAENTGKFLKSGQTVQVRLEGVGTLTNPVQSQPPAPPPDSR